MWKHQESDHFLNLSLVFETEQEAKAALPEMKRMAQKWVSNRRNNMGWAGEIIRAEAGRIGRNIRAEVTMLRTPVGGWPEGADIPARLGWPL